MKYHEPIIRLRCAKCGKYQVFDHVRYAQTPAEFCQCLKGKENARKIKTNNRNSKES